ncbi:hypothetical protein [Pedobacter rhodius]|uniref:Uncharacterized protein n=1 Tax=Pedobacter rhodius TaxID=3004098 RepID=A0ABT4KWF5_9SPHI|nr:hypothetical protein [Pedobacter sp. SJ11]MCZ4223267.1 hypothetical protein [Pedobacter sp. SJ11]
MELILKSNNEGSLDKIIALAKRLNVIVERKNIDFNNAARVNLKNRMLSFKASTPSFFGDAAEWQQHQRSDRE